MGQASIVDRLAEIRSRIDAACHRTGRDSSTVTLVGASKRQPIESLQAANAAGLVHFGENRVQEARDKRGALPDAIHWHLLGPLQSNKVALAVELFETFHAIDRPKIARAIDREAERREKTLRGFLEVNLGREDSKHGFDPDETLEELFGLRRELANLQLVGLMAIPPREDDPGRIRDWFRKLRSLRDRAHDRDPTFPGALSMGMSGDFELAIEEGATHIRVGTLLFGPRDGAATPIG